MNLPPAMNADAQRHPGARRRRLIGMICAAIAALIALIAAFVFLPQPPAYTGSFSLNDAALPAPSPGTLYWLEDYATNDACLVGLPALSPLVAVLYTATSPYYTSWDNCGNFAGTWSFTPYGSGWEIVNTVFTGPNNVEECLQTSGSNPAIPNGVFLGQCNGSPGQIWDLASAPSGPPASSGYVTICNTQVYNGQSVQLCLDSNGGPSPFAPDAGGLAAGGWGAVYAQGGNGGYNQDWDIVMDSD
jgi:hypothetical protein